MSLWVQTMSWLLQCLVNINAQFVFVWSHFSMLFVQLAGQMKRKESSKLRNAPPAMVWQHYPYHVCIATKSMLQLVAALACNKERPIELSGLWKRERDKAPLHAMCLTLFSDWHVWAAEVGEGVMFTYVLFLIEKARTLLHITRVALNEHLVYWG